MLLGRPRRRWKYNEMDLIGWCDMDSIGLAQDRVWWKAFLSGFLRRAQLREVT
jgi:hypothetical protein